MQIAIRSAEPEFELVGDGERNQAELTARLWLKEQPVIEVVAPE
jgi:hypothetical protein